VLDLRVGAGLVAALALSACSGNDTLDPAITCHVGAYADETGRFIDISPLDTTALRWRASDGRVGRIEADDAASWHGTVGWTSEASPAVFHLGDCGSDTISVTGLDGMSGAFERIAFDITETRFDSGELNLAGRLVLPEGEGPVPVVVWVHGSERSAARDFAYFQRILPALGVGVFVYDKRGTGGSEGEYSQDFPALAGDAVAALNEARRLAGDRIERLGYFGGSQGGWVAPLAATRSDPDFVMVVYGMLQSPLAEDALEVETHLRNLGYGDEVIAQAREITDATGQLMASRFAEGEEAFETAKRTYRDEPWYGDVRGEYTGDLLSYPVWMIRFAYNNFLDQGTSWDHDPMPVIRSVDVPVLWVLAEDDTEGPSLQTRDTILTLQSQGRDIDMAIFPDTEHGLVEYTVEDGERRSTRYAERYFQLLADWAQGETFAGSYGRAMLYPGPDAGVEQE